MDRVRRWYPGFGCVFFGSNSIFVLDLKAQQKMDWQGFRFGTKADKHVQEIKCAPLVDACFAEGFIYQGWGHRFYFLVFPSRLAPLGRSSYAGTEETQDLATFLFGSNSISWPESSKTIRFQGENIFNDEFDKHGSNAQQNKLHAPLLQFDASFCREFHQSRMFFFFLSNQRCRLDLNWTGWHLKIK